jgi:hypothetical protein
MRGYGLPTDQTVSRVFFSTASLARMHARAESTPDRAPHMSGFRTRIAAQKPEISFFVGDGPPSSAPDTLVGPPAALAGRVSDASTTAPTDGDT